MAELDFQDPRLHVLIVDDSKTARQHLCEILGNLGHTTSSVTNGKDSLDAIGRENFDLILVDLVLPDIDGIDVLRKVRQTHPETPIIIVTAFGSLQSAIAALRQGADDYITKPLDEAIMAVRIKAVMSAMELRRSHREHEKLKAAMATAGAAAHEINQPLMAILTASELLQQTTDQSRMNDLARMIAQQTKRMGDIVWKLSRLTSYKTMQYTRETDILDINASSGWGK